MATNKNQHFVPRVHLKAFATADSSDAIHLYNVDRDKIVLGAAVKHQCSGDYFYGRDQALDDAIQTVEREYGRVVRSLLAPQGCLSEEDHISLILFWHLQYLRTEAASRRSVEMLDELRTVVGIDQQTHGMAVKEAVQVAMRIFAHSIHQMTDLKGCIVRNDTDVPFVTSDDPAVFVNRWLTQIRPPIGRSFGLTSAGAIAVLPLTPEFAFVAYDADVHTIDATRGQIKLAQTNDVEAINALQYLNCQANIYSRSEASFEQVRKQYLALVPSRPKARFATHYAIKESEFQGTTRYVIVDRHAIPEDQDAIVHSETIHIRPRDWPRFLHWKSNGYAFALGPARTLVRRAVAETSQGLEYERVRTNVA
jgi:hypothetical protein